MAQLTNALADASGVGETAYHAVEVRFRADGLVRHSLVPDVVVGPSALRYQEESYVDPAVVRLVVEVESEASRLRDRYEKPWVYAEMGIPAMWRVEPDLTLVEYRLTPVGGPEAVRTVTGGTFTTDVPFPVTIDLDVLR